MAGLILNSARQAEPGTDPARIDSSTSLCAPPITSTGTFERIFSIFSPAASDNIAAVASDLKADGPSPVVKTKICSSASKGLPEDIEQEANVVAGFGSGSAPGTGTVATSALGGS